jgi:hypothetical protein
MQIFGNANKLERRQQRFVRRVCCARADVIGSRMVEFPSSTRLLSPVPPSNNDDKNVGHSKRLRAIPLLQQKSRPPLNYGEDEETGAVTVNRKISTKKGPLLTDPNETARAHKGKRWQLFSHPKATPGPG